MILCPWRHTARRDRDRRCTPASSVHVTPGSSIHVRPLAVVPRLAGTAASTRMNGCDRMACLVHVWLGGVPESTDLPWRR